MNWYEHYKLVHNNGGYDLEIYLNMDFVEFADEFLSDDKNEKPLKLEDRVANLLKEKFLNIKINSIKLMVGAIAIATLPLYSATAAAADATSASVSQSTMNETYKVTASKLNVRTGPSTSYSIMHTLWKGNQVKVIGESDGWYNIKLSDGRTGWVSKNYMAPQLNTTGVVTASKLNVRTGPSASHTIMHILWKGNQVKVIDESNNWYRIKLSDGRTGWVSKSYLQLSQSNQQKINKVIETAKSLIGTPYVFGGESLAEGGFDCSGLTQYVYKQVGYTLNRISSDQATQGIYVSRSKMQPGDLVFYSFNNNGKIDHVGIYIGNGQMIHSPKPGDTVKTANINVTYWQQRHIATRRIIH